MTREEELIYLGDLLMQAALWRVQPDEEEPRLNSMYLADSKD